MTLIKYKYVPKQVSLTPMQSLAHRTFWHSKTYALSCVTGFGGAKTFFLAFTANYAAEKYPGLYMMCGSPTFPMMKRTIWRTLLEFTPKGNIVKVNNADMIIVLDYHDGHQPPVQIDCLSASVPAQNWQGPNLGLILLDESDGIPDAHYTQCKARLRQTVDYQDGRGPVEMPNKMLIATNPPPDDHWLPRDFHDPTTKKKRHKLLQWSSLDNPHTPDQYKRNLLDTYHGDERKSAVFGKIGFRFAGQFYDNFDKAYHVLEENYANKIRRESTLRIYGMDHGYTAPFAFIELCYWKKMEAWVATREFYQSRLTIRQKAKGIVRIYPEITGEYPWSCYSDHAAQDRVELEREHGIITEPAIKKTKRDKRKGKSTVDDSYQFVKTMLERNDNTKHASLFISARCENLIREFGSFRNAKSPLTEEFREYVYEGPNHALDAVRYALYTYAARNPSLFIAGGERDHHDFGESRVKQYTPADVRVIESGGWEEEDDSYGNDEAYFGH